MVSSKDAAASVASAPRPKSAGGAVMRAGIIRRRPPKKPVPTSSISTSTPVEPVSLSNEPIEPNISEKKEDPSFIKEAVKEDVEVMKSEDDLEEEEKKKKKEFKEEKKKRHPELESDDEIEVPEPTPAAAEVMSDVPFSSFDLSPWMVESLHSLLFPFLCDIL